jgi:hypothetical protein
MNTQVPAQTQPEDFSLILGGPLYQLYLRSGLVRYPAGLVHRRIAAFIAVTWLPLVLLNLVGGTAFGGVEVPFLFDLDVHIRFLLALPLLIGAEVLVHQRIRTTVQQFIDRGIVAPELRLRFDELIASTMRLRNSVTVEITLIVCSITLGYFIWREQNTLHVGTWYAREGSLTVAGWWYAFISLNLFRFVLLRWYFRLIVWYIFLWRVARLPLRLNPLHPDRSGGMGFLGGSVFAFAPILLAHTVVFSGIIGGRILHEGAKLPAFQMEIAAAVAVLMVVALLPLSFFVPKLAQAKREAMREYGLLAMQYVDGFRDKWLRGRKPEGEPLVGSADIQSLADLAGGHDVLREMRLLPFGRQTIVALAIAIALPYLPLTLTMIPFKDLVTMLIGKLI